MASSLAPALCQPWPPLEGAPLSPEAHLGQDSSLTDAPAGLGLLLESLEPGAWSSPGGLPLYPDLEALMSHWAMPCPLWQLRMWMSTCPSSCLSSEATDSCMSPASRAWTGPLFFMSVSKAQGFSAQEESLLQWWRHSSPTGLLPPLALPQERDRATFPRSSWRRPEE